MARHQDTTQHPGWWWRALVLLPILFGLGGCSDPPALRVGSNQWPGYEPVYLARDLGAFGRSSVHLVELPAATDVMQYLRSGNLDAGMLTLDETLSLLAEGVSLRVILVMDVSDGADAVLAHPGIERIEDLEGKRLGAEISAVGSLLLESLLEAGHLQAGSIEIVPLTVDQQAEAFRHGAVDAVITFEPTRSHLLADGAVELFNSSQILGRIIDVLVVQTAVMEAQTGHLKQLLSGYFQAREYMRRHPGLAVARMAPRVFMTPRDLDAAYHGMQLPDLAENRLWLKRGGPGLTDAAARLGNFMRRKHLIDTLPDLSSLADDRFLPERAVQE